MAEFPMFPLWTDAYLTDTGEANLTTLEHGAYLLLLMTMWRAGGHLPNDDAKLARYTKLGPSQWSKVRPVLDQFLRVEGDKITQGRLLDELERARGRSRAAADNARAKHRKNNTSEPASAQSSHSEPAATRLDQTTTTTTGEKKGGAEFTQEALAAFAEWNNMAARAGLPIAQKLSAPRYSRLRSRLDDAGGIEGWKIAVQLVAESSFLTGRTKQNFRASLDFMLQESSFTKLMEGNYADTDMRRKPSAAMEALRKIREEQ